MAHVERFEDLIAWQKSRDLCVLIYQTTRTMNDFGFKDQIQRATLSISNNIAEGFERHSSKEFVRFLSISKGSAGEVRSMLLVGNKLNYFDDTQSKKLISDVTEISKILSALMNSLK